MAQQASDYHRGEMDIQEQAATYRFVMSMTKWVSLISLVTLLFLTLWFCTGAGFMGALAASVVVAVIGFVVLRGDGGH